MELSELTDKVIDGVLSQLADERRLTPWEKDFIESVTDDWTRNRFLTIGQKMKLGEIHDRY